ncbi:MAG: hypothetical protein FJ145_12395 [Deltaproteobacteria bacterium]|nr:hypothetical protein [Deltaproteobacteria bacterium]
MRNNPVLRESLAVFFVEGQGFQVYFYLLVILAPIHFLSLYLPSLDVQAWTGSAGLFKITSVTTLLLVAYFALRVANQEFAPWRFKALRHWVMNEQLAPMTIGRGQLAFLGLHVLCSLGLCLPFLFWAAAIARTPLVTVGGALALLLFYTFAYGVWGLVALVLWDRRAESRQVFVRCFFFGLLLLSGLFYLPLNPVAFLLAYVGRQELVPLNVFGWRLPAPWVHLSFHLLLGALGLLMHRWALRRELA